MSLIDMLENLNDSNAHLLIGQLVRDNARLVKKNKNGNQARRALQQAYDLRLLRLTKVEQELQDLKIKQFNQLTEATG